MEETAVIELLRKRKGDRSLMDIAPEIGVSFQYLSEVLRGEKPPSDKILTYLGLKREIVKAK